MVSLDGVVLGWNGAAEQILGYRANEIVGRPVGQLDTYSDEARQGVFYKAAARGRVERAIMLRHRDGHQIPAMLTLTPLREDGGEVAAIVGLIKDIAPWLRRTSGAAEPAVEALALSALQEVAIRMASSLNIDETLGALAESITTVVGADAGVVMMHDAASRRIRARKVFGNRLAAFAELDLPDDRGMAAAAINTGEIQRIDDYAAQPEDRRVASSVVAEEPVRSAVFVPLSRGGRRAGAMVAYRRRVEPFSDQAVSLLSTFANHASVALDNALAYSELADARRRLEVLLDSTSAIWQVLSFPDMCERLAEQARRMVPSAEVVISVLVPDRPDAFRILGAAGPWARSLLGLEGATGGSQAAAAIRAARPVEIEAGAHLQDAVRAQLARGGIRRARLVPLNTGSRLPDGRLALGVLGFYRRERTPFTDDERRLIDEFGRRASLALHRAELLANANRTAKRLEVVIDVAAELAKSLEPRRVVRRLLERAVQAVEADRGALLRVVGEDTVVEDAYDIDGRQDLIGYRHPIAAQPLMAEAIESRLPVLGRTFNSDILPEDLRIALDGVRYTATVPLNLDRDVLAVLVLSRRRERPFGQNDVSVLQLIGNQAVLALRNARLFAQVQESSRVKSDFLNLAAHELRTPLSVITGYLSMLQEGTFGTAPPDWQQPVEMLASKAHELTQLVDDLLLAARLEAGTVPTATARVDLCQVARGAVARAEPRAVLISGRIELDLPNRPVLVDADPDHVARILDNLVNNAFTYSPQDPWVKVSVASEPDPCIRVEDRGRGIPEEMRERIFERFIRIDDPELRRPGTGLGLPISRELAERHGGSLTLEWSEVGKGSAFLLRFPPAT